MQKNTAYRRWPELLEAGIVLPAAKGSDKYIVNPKESRIRAADFFEASLQLLEDPAIRKSSEQTEGVLSELRMGLLQSAVPLFVVRQRADTSKATENQETSSVATAGA